VETVEIFDDHFMPVLAYKGPSPRIRQPSRWPPERSWVRTVPTHGLLYGRRRVRASLKHANIAAIREWKLGRRFLLPEFLGIDAVLGAARGVLVTEERRPADEVDG
jgi:hypothetical protein